MNIFYFVLNQSKFMEKEIKNDVRGAILLHLDGIERTLAWLSDKTQIPYPTLYSVFKQRTFVLSDRNLAKINRALDTDFIND